MGQYLIRKHVLSSCSIVDSSAKMAIKCSTKGTSHLIGSTKRHAEVKISHHSRHEHTHRGDDGEKVEFRRITIGVARKIDGKRIRDKKLCCFVCRQKVLWLSRHLQRQHSDNYLIAQVMAKTGSARQQGLKRLKNLGSFLHNVDVLRKASGELIVARRSNSEQNPEKYLPCVHCYGFYYMYDLWRHVCPCVRTSVEAKSGDLVDSSRSLLDGAIDAEDSHVDKNFKYGVLNRMRRDRNLATVKADALILRFGTTQLKRIGLKGRRRIAMRMRLLARLLDQLRQSTGSRGASLSEFLDGTYFDAFIEAVEILCGLHTDEHGNSLFATPSLALMIGNIVPKCCQVKKGMAIRQGDEFKEKQVERFMDLFRSEYGNVASCPALLMLKSKRYNKPDELPSTEDLLKLKAFTEQQLETLCSQLKAEPEYSTWRSLSEIVLTKLLVFNKRRASEPVKLELSQYLNRPKWQNASNREIVSNLNAVEKKLMQRMDMVQVPGKRNRRVPILITPEVGIAMNVLADTRRQCGISQHNRYFFATDSSDGHLNTWLVLHNTAVAAGVEKPRLITSSRLRKYVATLSQVYQAVAFSIFLLITFCYSVINFPIFVFYFSLSSY